VSSDEMKTFRVNEVYQRERQRGSEVEECWFMRYSVNDE
jgi:hypothetical protein